MAKKILSPRFPFFVPTRSLIFIAGSVWTLAGCILLYRGFFMLFETEEAIWIKLVFSIILGLLFYFFLFNKISSKHIHRLESKKNTHAPVFSFFNKRSYLLMTLMIVMGITLRKTEIVPVKYLAVLYITMGIPLMISAVKFYVCGFRNLKHNGAARTK